MLNNWSSSISTNTTVTLYSIITLEAKKRISSSIEVPKRCVRVPLLWRRESICQEAIRHGSTEMLLNGRVPVSFVLAVISNNLTWPHVYYYRTHTITYVHVLSLNITKINITFTQTNPLILSNLIPTFWCPYRWRHHGRIVHFGQSREYARIRPDQAILATPYIVVPRLEEQCYYCNCNWWLSIHMHMSSICTV